MSAPLRKIKSLHGNFEDRFIQSIETFLESEGFRLVKTKPSNGTIYIKDILWLYAIFVPGRGTFSVSITPNEIRLTRRLYNELEFTTIFKGVYRSVGEFVIVYNKIVDVVRKGA